HLPAVAGIIIALLIISVGFVMWSKMSSGLDDAGKQLDAMNNRIATEAYAELDGRTDVSGSTVIGFVADHQEDATWMIITNKSGELIRINTPTSATGASNASYSKGTHSIGALTGTPTANQVVSAMKNKSNSGKGYINPAWVYKATVTYDGAAIAGIEFVKQ
ncbi:MAG: hypothetical protein J6Y90_07445, partial [Lachnospiraceae bacterium]|nr:hypothetical protein [Lachnospiraceae bacterium]